MRLLDLYSGAGLAADGYHAAGFTEIVGVDINPQPSYPYEFVQGDALEYLRAIVHSDDPRSHDFDAIHASPPCQEHTRAKHLRNKQGGTSKYGDLLSPTLDLLWDLGVIRLPWVVENVPGAPGMEGAVVECGSAYGLQVQRHRLFLSNVPLVGSGCNHKSFPLDPVTGKPRPWGVYHVPADEVPSGGRTCRNAEHARECMGVDRNLTWQELKEGFPPAYSRHIGGQLIAALTLTP